MSNISIKNYYARKILDNAAVLAAVLFVCSSAGYAQEYVQERSPEYTRLSCAIHVSSTISDGKYTLEEIADIAAGEGIDVLIPTDRDAMSWEYGLWPLRNIFKKRVEERSILSYGAQKYLQRITAVQAAHPDMIIVPGIESAPYYRWQGNIWDDTLAIRDWHKHLLVIGLSDPADLEYLPVAGNPKGLMEPFMWRNIFLFWPLLPAALGIWCVCRRVYSYTGASGRIAGQHSRGWRLTGITLICAGILLLMNNYPFRSRTFDQYGTNKGAMPYQNLIGYANSRDALTFWAHPEAANIDTSGPVAIETPAHSDDMLRTEGYTGFCIFYEGFKKVGAVAGIWDQILAAYCTGARQRPVWAIAGLAYDKRGSLTRVLEDQRTVILSATATAAGVLEALKSGRAYCMRGRGAAAFSLDEFAVIDASGNSKTMGEEARVQGPVEIGIKGSLLHGQDQAFTIQLIRDGKIVRVFETQSPFDITYTDTPGSAAPRSYYRAQITSKDLTVVTNPVFVKKVIP